MHAHLSGDVGQHLVAVFQLDAKHRIGQRLVDGAFHDDGVFFGLRQGDSSVADGRDSTIAAECEVWAAATASAPGGVGNRRNGRIRCNTVLRSSKSARAD